MYKDASTITETKYVPNQSRSPIQGHVIPNEHLTQHLYNWRGLNMRVVQGAWDYVGGKWRRHENCRKGQPAHVGRRRSFALGIVRRFCGRFRWQYFREAQKCWYFREIQSCNISEWRQFVLRRMASSSVSQVLRLSFYSSNLRIWKDTSWTGLYMHQNPWEMEIYLHGVGW